MHTYRLYFRYRQWIGKADPSGFGTAFFYSSDPYWVFEKATKLNKNGHQVLKIQKRISDSVEQWETVIPGWCF